jgi:ApaG protein
LHAIEVALVTYSATTGDIVVRVSPVYIDGQSNMMDRRFVFGYFVRIANTGPEAVQLLSRRWEIRDSSGKLEEIQGDGVIGKQPVIESGGAHEYSSFCVLQSFEGSMEGAYTMLRENGETFEVEIPRFELRAAAN